MDSEVEVYRPKHHIRVVTATSLFDGHDASINIMRRILQATGCEVIHLGHNRSAEEIVNAAIEEDAHGIGISSYQGGHIEFFKYIIDLLKEKGSSQIRVLGGGGGVIVPEEIRELEEYGVAKIYTPEDGSKMGLQGIINHMVKTLDFSTIDGRSLNPGDLSADNRGLIAGLITAMELAKADENGDLLKLRSDIQKAVKNRKTPVLGIPRCRESLRPAFFDC